jgi:hypothetical protein
MNATVRQELHGFIDAMPEYNFGAARSVLSSLVEPVPAINEPLVIETDLTESEKRIIAAGRLERKEHPESFISLNDYLKTRL